MKKKYLLSFIFLFCFPLITCAYSDYIIASGKNIAISLNADHVIIVGSYDVNGKNILNPITNISPIYFVIDNTK